MVTLLWFLMKRISPTYIYIYQIYCIDLAVFSRHPHAPSHSCLLVSPASVGVLARYDLCEALQSTAPFWASKMVFLDVDLSNAEVFQKFQ